jgi:hypothetical protein
MAGNRDGDVADFAVADSRILGQGHHAFLVYRDDARCELEFLPHDFASVCAFAGERFAVWPGQRHNDARFLPGGRFTVPFLISRPSTLRAFYPDKLSNRT